MMDESNENASYRVGDGNFSLYWCFVAVLAPIAVRVSNICGIDENALHVFYCDCLISICT